MLISTVFSAGHVAIFPSYFTECLLGRGHTILTSRELMWYYACCWDVRGDLKLNSMAQVLTCHSANITWYDVELWSVHVPARLSYFCCRTHFVWREVHVHCSSDINSCFQKLRKFLLKKCANRPLYLTLSHLIIEKSIWQQTHWKG